jgi:hypothetical protein
MRELAIIRRRNVMASAGTAIDLDCAPPLPVNDPRVQDVPLDASSFPHCAFCRRPLRFTPMGVNAWRLGERFFCNEFCADSAAN